MSNLTSTPSSTKTCRHPDAASDPTASFCGHCGADLMRCMAHATCGGFVDDRGLCQNCFAPSLFLDAGAVQDVTAGGTLALPLRLSNRAVSGRPVFVTGVWTRESGDWQPCPLVWDRLDPGEAQPFTVRANDLDKPGAHGIEILIALASRWQWREEVVMFSASLSLTAKGQSSITVNQNITNNAAQESFGNTNYAPIRIQTGGEAEKQASSRPIELSLVRATRTEVEFGLRGMEDGRQVCRNAEFRWVGFPKDERPENGPITSQDALLAFGRERTKPGGGSNDVRLTVHEPHGALDRESSLYFSRRHFDIFIVNDRLVARAQSDAGMQVNGKHHKRGVEVVLDDGDVITPSDVLSDRLSMKLRFDSHIDGIVAVTITRQPALPEGGQS